MSFKSEITNKQNDLGEQSEALSYMKTVCFGHVEFQNPNTHTPHRHWKNTVFQKFKLMRLDFHTSASIFSFDESYILYR